MCVTKASQVQCTTLVDWQELVLVENSLPPKDQTGKTESFPRLDFGHF
jgi:hypothetical protein